MAMSSACSSSDNVASNSGSLPTSKIWAAGLSHDDDFNLTCDVYFKARLNHAVIKHSFATFGQSDFCIYRNSNAERNIAGARFRR